MKKISFILISLIMFGLFFTVSCSNPTFQSSTVNNENIEIKDIPSKEDCDTKPNKSELEEEFERALGTNLWKATYSADNSANIDVYIKITNKDKNYIEFNTSNTLKTYSYKVIEGKWVILSNKNKTLPIKFVSNTSSEVIIHSPLDIIISKHSYLGCKLVFKVSSDDVHLEDNSNPNGEVTPNPEPGTNPEEKPSPNPGTDPENPGDKPKPEPGTDPENPGDKPNPTPDTDPENPTPGPDVKPNPDDKPGTDPDPGTNPEKPNPDPETKPEPAPSIPEEKNFIDITSSMSGADFIALINKEQLSNIYMNVNDDFHDNLIYEEGTIVIADNTFTLTCPSGNQQFKFDITKIEKKVDDINQVYVAILNVTEVPANNAEPNKNIINFNTGLHYLTFEKRGNDSKVIFLDKALCPIFITTKESVSPKMTFIDISTDVMTKLISLMINSEEYLLLLQVPGEIYPTNFGIPILVDNKMYLNKKNTTDFIVIKGGFGKLNTRGGRLSACARIEFSNSQFEYLKNKSYDFGIFNDTRLFNGYAKGEPVVFIGPKDTPVGIQEETIEEFHIGFAPHLNQEGTMEINRVPVEGKKYKIIRDQNNLYKIVESDNNNLFVSFEVLKAAVTGTSHSASFKVVESNSDLLIKDKFYQILDSYRGFYLSEYDQNYFIELKWKKRP